MFGKLILLYFVIFCFLIRVTCAQDEKVIREMLSGEMAKKEEVKVVEKEYSWTAGSALYQYDLDEDGYMEGLQIQKKDSEDWFYIYDKNQKEVLKKQLDTKGRFSRLYKLSLVKIAPNTKVMILHFYQGFVEYDDFYASACFYFVTFDNNDLNTMQITQGPTFFEEQQNKRKDYHLKKYKWNVFDFDKDGTKELIVKYNKISKIFIYRGKGVWKDF